MEIAAKYDRSKGSVYLCGYHFVWTTKYRRQILFLEDMAIDARLKELIKEKADERGWRIEALETMPDHVHVFLYATQNDSPRYIANQLKGYTSRVLRSEFPVCRSRVPSLWTRSYFVATVGQISADTVKSYVESQRDKP